MLVASIRAKLQAQLIASPLTDSV